MANVRQTDTPPRTGLGVPDEALGPDKNAFETELERAELSLRHAREHPLFGVHPDGFGPTLGQDFRRPKPGQDADGEHEAYDPPA